MAKKQEPRPPDPSTMSYEQAAGALESIIEEIEEGSIGLEQSIASYRYGTALIKRCREILDKAEQEIEVLEAGSRDESPSGAPNADDEE
jgi:exodeoxyribonuclease VII small subunit